LRARPPYQKIVAFIALQRDRLNAVFGAGFRRAPAQGNRVNWPERASYAA